MNFRWKRKVATLTILAACGMACAQTPTKYIGAITQMAGTTLTVKTDAGEVHIVQVPAEASLKRIAPGERDLSKAEAIAFSGLASGDRVLVKIDPESTAGHEQALQIIAIKQADVTAKQQKDREDWQRRGVGGLVKSIDAASGLITISSGAGQNAKTVVVKTSNATILKRYASASIRYDAAQTAPISAIHAGDQLRARGQKNTEGSEIVAEEVISGSFRNLSGTIATLDAAQGTLGIKDLATKKNITIHAGSDTQLRQIPERMAQMLASRLNGAAAAASASGWNGQRSAGAPPSGGPGAQGGAWASAAQGGGDPQQFLNHAPVVALSALKKGDAIMVVATGDDGEVQAITILAGVEALLQAPAAQNMLANWSMGGGEGAQ